MDLKKRTPSGREKDEAAVKLLEHLRHRLHFGNTSSARRVAAFRLSWMQEDGLDILKEALYGKATRSTKSAAAYGLRKMRGRMKKIALEVLEKGSKHKDHNTRKTCENTMLLLSKKRLPKHAARRRAPGGRTPIREIKPQTGRRKKTEQMRKEN